MSEKKRRLIEWGKDGLIVLLVLLALWLVGRPQLYGRQLNEWLNTVRSRGLQAAETGTTVQLDMRQVLKPVRMAVMTEQGRYGTPGDSTGTQQLFSTGADLLNEALSSAGQPRRVRTAEWERALQTAPGMYFEFSYSLPLSTLSELLSGGLNNSALSGRAGKLCLVAEEDGVRLYYLDDEDGQCYVCATDVVSTAQLETAVSGAVPNGITFAFERDDCGALASYTMLPDHTPQVSVVQAEELLTEENRTLLLKQLFFRSQSPDYEATDGMVYLDSGDMLRVRNDGTVIYSASGEEKRFTVPARAGKPTQAEYIYAAFWLVHQAMDPWQGAAELQLTGYEQQEDGTVLVEFEYFINGIQISRTRGGCGAEVKMEQSRITGLQLRMRGYSPTAETTALLPVTQAAAAVSALGEDGGEMVPCYQDTGEETLRAGWVVKK